MSMSMKNLVLVAAMAAAAAGCADDLRPLQVGAARPLDRECTADENIQRPVGALDIALRANYLIAFEVSSQLSADDVQVGEDTVVRGTRNDFIVQEVEFSYTSEPAGAFVAERLPLHAVIKAETTSLMNIPLIAPKAYTALSTLVDTHEVVRLMATFRLKGKLASGLEAESSEVTFPITVFNTRFSACPAGTVLQHTGPCGGLPGQDEATIDPAVICQAPQSNNP